LIEATIDDKFYGKATAFADQDVDNKHRAAIYAECNEQTQEETGKLFLVSAELHEQLGKTARTVTKCIDGKRLIHFTGNVPPPKVKVKEKTGKKR